MNYVLAHEEAKRRSAKDARFAVRTSSSNRALLREVAALDEFRALLNDPEAVQLIEPGAAPRPDRCCGPGGAERLGNRPGQPLPGDLTGSILRTLEEQGCPVIAFGLSKDADDRRHLVLALGAQRVRAMRENGSLPPAFKFDEDHSYFATVLPVHPEARTATSDLGGSLGG